MPSKTFKRKNIKSKNKNKKTLKRNSKSISRSKKMRSNVRKMRGGANTQPALNTTESTEQDDFFVSIYDLFLGKDSKKFIDKTQIDATREEVFHYFFKYVYSKEHVFTNNYVAKLVINLCKPYLKAYIIFKEVKLISRIEARFDEIIDNLNKFVEDKAFIPEKGSILKKYGLTNLTAKPEKALELLNTCKDDELYCPMDIEYYFSDYISNKPHLCDVETANPEHDIDDDEFYNNNIFRINNAEELSNFKTNKVYLYSMLPDETLCLFKEEKYSNHHSAGSCGQPVICAGFITVENGKIKTFNNDSGHYKPPIKMIIKFRDILLRKGMIENEGNIGVIPPSGTIPFFLITVDIVDKSMLTPLYFPYNERGKPINTSSKNSKAKLENN